MADEDMILRASLEDDLSKPLGKVRDSVEDVGEAGEKAARGLDKTSRSAATADSRLSKLAKGGLTKLGTYAKRAAIGVAAIGTGIVATVGAKGISRLLGIEDAQAKMKGLGHSSKTIASAMKSSLDLFRGTAFGLADATNVAADALAVGVSKSGLTDYLKLTADMATIAQKPLGDIGAILNKVQGDGKLTGETLQQFTENGLGGIGPMLAKARGVSIGELRKLVSQGKVTSEEFKKVVEKNIGGAALESGKTTRGAWANMMASLGRIGAGLLAGVFPKGKETMNAVTEWLGPIETQAAAWGQKIAKWDIGGKIAAGWDKASPVIGDVVAWPSDLWDSLQPVGPALMEFGQTYGPIVIAMLAGIVAAGWPVVDWLLNSLGPAITTVLGFLSDNRDAVLTFVAIAGGAQVAALAFLKVKAAITALRAGMIALNVVMAANPVTLVVLALAALAAAAVWAYQNVDWFRSACNKAWEILKYLGAWIKTIFIAYLVALGVVWTTLGLVAVKAVRFMVNAVLGYFARMLAGAEKAFGWIPGIGPKIKSARKGFDAFRAGVDQAMGGAEKKLKSTRDKIIDFGKTHVKKPKLDLDTSEVDRKVREAQRLINGMNGKTVRIAVTGGTGGGITKGDTPTSRAAGGRSGPRSAQLQRTLSAHNRINAALGGRYMVSNALIGGGGRGRGSGDHQRGRAVDVVGRNLPAYAQAVRAEGGYAAVHGNHVHAVMGDTATPRRGGVGTASGSRRTVVVQAGAITILADGGDPATIKQAVKDALSEIEREDEEVDA